MAVLFWQNATTWIHDTDFTGQLKKVSLNVKADELDATTFGSTYKSRIGGLKDVTVGTEGFWESTQDLSGFSGLAQADRVVTICPQGAETNVAYLLQAGDFNYETFGTIGETVPFMLGLSGTNNVRAVRGQLAKAKGNVSATGQLGSILNLGAPTATQFVYAAVHIFTAGTTITIQLQSDDNAPFASATTRATIGPLTTTGGTWMTRLAGPFAGETFWRLNVSAITGTFSIAAAVGIQ